jgi:hypothetical protein
LAFSAEFEAIPVFASMFIPEPIKYGLAEATDF